MAAAAAVGSTSLPAGLVGDSRYSSSLVVGSRCSRRCSPGVVVVVGIGYTGLEIAGVGMVVEVRRWWYRIVNLSLGLVLVLVLGRVDSKDRRRCGGFGIGVRSRIGLGLGGGGRVGGKRGVGIWRTLWFVCLFVCLLGLFLWIFELRV